MHLTEMVVEGNAQAVNPQDWLAQALLPTYAKL